MSGKLVPMPCGHAGEVIAHPSFAVCRTSGCDGQTGLRCHKCPSRRLAPFVAPFCPPDAIHCLDCGAVRWSGVG